MVQKSGVHQLRLVVNIYHYLRGFISCQVVLAGFLNHQQYHHQKTPRGPVLRNMEGIFFQFRKGVLPVSTFTSWQHLGPKRQKLNFWWPTYKIPRSTQRSSSGIRRPSLRCAKLYWQVLNPHPVATLCSSYSRETGHLLLITIRTSQYIIA